MTWFDFTLIAIVIFVLLLFLHFCSEGTVYPYEHYLCSKVCHYPVDHVDFRSPPASTKFKMLCVTCVQGKGKVWARALMLA